jgi:hypothetical protein
MNVVRVTAEDVRGYDNSKLVGDFEVTSRSAFDESLSMREQEEHGKNLNVLRTEIYRRME